MTNVRYSQDQVIQKFTQKRVVQKEKRVIDITAATPLFLISMERFLTCTPHNQNTKIKKIKKNKKREKSLLNIFLVQFFLNDILLNSNYDREFIKL